jgi:hypothetical protein
MNFLKAHKQFVESLDSSKPFISETVLKSFDQYNDHLIGAKMVGISGMSRGKNTEYRKEARLALEECAIAIRKRLSDMLVV